MGPPPSFFVGYLAIRDPWLKIPGRTGQSEGPGLRSLRRMFPQACFLATNSFRFSHLQAAR